MQNDVKATQVNYFNPELSLAMLDTIPDDWQLVPVTSGYANADKGLGKKCCLEPNWTKTNFTKADISQRIRDGKAWGFSILLNGDYVAVDIDGIEGETALKSIMQGETINTVSWTSGKLNRYQMLFKLPVGADKSKLCRKVSKLTEQLDFRYNNVASVLPSSYHSKEFGTYNWVAGKSPSEIEVAVMPDALYKEFLSLITPVKATRKPKGFDSELAKQKLRFDAEAVLGNRNQALNRVAFFLIHTYPRNESELRIALTSWGLDSGLEESEIEATLNSAFNKDDRPDEWDTLTLVEALRQETNLKLDSSSSAIYEYDGSKWLPINEKKFDVDVLEFIASKTGNQKLSYAQEIVAILSGKLDNIDFSNQKLGGNLPFTNGLLDLATKELLPHTPDYFNTYVLPREFKSNTVVTKLPTATDKYLTHLANNNQENKNLLVAFLAAVLTNRLDLGKTLHLYGSGNKGKSVYLRLCTELVGSVNSYATTLSRLDSRFDAANIIGKKLVMLGDEDRFRGGVSTFKELVTGGSLNAEKKGKDSFNFFPSATVVIASNNPIFTGNLDSGIRRRVISFACDNVVTQSDPDLIDKLINELPELTNYLINLDSDWVKQAVLNLETPAVKRATLENEILSNNVSAFVNEAFVASPEARIVEQSFIYPAYNNFCKVNGLQAQGKIRMINEFKDSCKRILGVTIGDAKTNGIRYYTNIELRPEE